MSINSIRENYDWLDLQGAAGYLGVSDRQIRRWTQQGRLGYVKLGLQLRFEVAELDDFVRRSRVQPQR